MATSVLDGAISSVSDAGGEPIPARRTSWHRLLPWLVLATAIGLAVVHYCQFLEVHRHLWDGGGHDRNAHYLFILKMAADLRRGDLPGFLVHVETARVWGPLQDVLAAALVAATHGDYRVAVLPSLAGWILTVFFAFLLARRAVGPGGNVAGLAAVLFVLVSPAHKAFATDLMLESLGAGLTLAVLYCYVVAVQEGAARSGRWLGLALTLLFLHKSNYWLLAAFALAACTVMASRRYFLHRVRTQIDGFDFRSWARRQSLHPLIYVLVTLLVAIATILQRGDRPIQFFGTDLSVYPPHTFIQLAFIVCVCRVLPWWRREGRRQVAELAPPWQQVIRWHVYPLVVWFLLPKRLSSFLWYVGPFDAMDNQHADLRQGLIDYWHWAVADYHVSMASAVLVAAFVGLALLARQAWRPGGKVVLWLFLLAAVLAASHPNRKGRNLHSWIATGWVAAGAGLAALARGAGAVLRGPVLRPWLGAAALGGLALTHGAHIAVAGIAPEGGPHPARPSLCDVMDAALDQCDTSQRFSVLTMDALQPLVQWAVFQRDGALDRLEPHWQGFGDDGLSNVQGFERWLAAPTVDTLLVFDRTGGPPPLYLSSACLLHGELRATLAAQRRFRLMRRLPFPEHGIEVQVWQRRLYEARN